MNETRVLVCGSRGWRNRELIRYKLVWFYEPKTLLTALNGAA